MNRDLYRIVSWQSLQVCLVMGDTFAIIFQFRSAFEMQILSSGKKLFQQHKQQQQSQTNVLTKSQNISQFVYKSCKHIAYICLYVCVCVYIDIYLLTFIIKQGSFPAVVSDQFSSFVSTAAPTPCRSLSLSSPSPSLSLSLSLGGLKGNVNMQLTFLCDAQTKNEILADRRRSHTLTVHSQSTKISDRLSGQTY